MCRIKHHLSEEYLQSLTEEERVRQMSEWTIEEQERYFCPNGTMTLDEFLELVRKIITEEYERMGWNYEEEEREYTDD